MKGFFTSKGFFHLLVALVILPFQQILPEFVKVAFIPYIFYLVFRKDPIYLPALFAYVTPGTTIIYAVLISTLALTIININKLSKKGLNNFLWTSFLPMPFFLYMTFVRVFELGEGLVNILVSMDYYLGIFPFYYGVLTIKKFDARSYYGFVFTFFILSIFNFFEIIDYSVRMHWLSYPLFLVIFSFYCFKAFRRGKIELNLLILSILFLLIYKLPSFTLLFSGISGMLLAYLKVYNKTFFLSFFTKSKVILLFIGILTAVSFVTNEKLYLMYKNVDFLENKYYESWDLFTDKLYYKAFADRAPIWLGGWNSILDNNEYYLVPPYEPLKYSIKSLSGSEFEADNLPIHNLLLELMRMYGFSIGALVFFIFMFFMIKGPGAYLLNSKLKNTALLLLAATTIGTGFVGALVGQFPLMGTFSISLISIFGIFYGLNHERLNLKLP